MGQKNGLLIIAVYSGLGNQMFHYAFYKYLLFKGYNVYLDIDSPMNMVQHQKHETFRLHYFNLPDLKFAQKENTEKLIDISFLPFSKAIKNGKAITVMLIILQKIFRKICRKLKMKIKHKYFWMEWEHGKEFYRNGLNFSTRAYMIGRYQEYSYLKNMRKELLNDFQFTQKPPKSVKSILGRVNKEHSVSIHIRRRDYAGATEFDICSINYYKKAVEYIASLKTDLSYYIFSDDIEWVEEHFDFIEQYQIVDNSQYENSDYWDLYLMSRCKYNIIANSTFSWWGAWLNQNSGKIICTPEKWNGYDLVLTDEICPMEWKRIKV